jgi:prolyl 4-hydroxylase|tara:strand:- start:10098 stop:11321 length:1224 start_codon:yes stop_codon:yes gene_type:complete
MSTPQSATMRTTRASGRRARRIGGAALVACVIAALASRGRADDGDVVVDDDQRLIGWLGEVARPPAPDVADGAGAGRASVDDDDASSSSSMTTFATTTTTSGEEAPRTSTSGGGGDEDDVERSKVVETLSWSPRVFLLKNFLSDEECEHLIELGEKKLERSTVVNSDESGAVSTARTSFGTFVTRRLTETLQRVEDRVAKYSGIPWEHQEQLQLLRYRDGQEYVAHHDGIISENGGKRIATVLMFLREPTSGGETSFPQGTPLPETKAAFLANKDKLSECGWNDGNGFSVIPKKGEAVLFFSFHINGTNDPFANHASCPTLGGTKYTATKWIHENPFETGTAKTPTCTDETELCPVWAQGHECERNPVFMMGEESVGACSKSCCARDRSKLTDIQKSFCVPCDKVTV